MGRKYMGSSFGGRKSLLRWIGDELEKRTETGKKYNTPKPGKLTAKEQEALERQAEFERHQKTSEYLESKDIEFFNYQIMVKGYSIKGKVQDLMLLNQGATYNTVYIKEHDLEVKCDYVLFCYSHKVQKYIWFGFDKELYTAYILFYSNSLDDMIKDHDIDQINMHIFDHWWESDTMLRENTMLELKHINGFYNMQEGGTEIIDKGQLFDLIEDIPIKEGEKIRKKHILEV